MVGNTNRLPQIMANCKWCITNAGITMLEMIFLKKIVFSYSNNHKEEILAKIMLKRKLIKGCNLDLIDYEKYLNCNLENNIYFDGQGANKIVEDIENYIFYG